MKNNPRVSFITINYNSSKYTLELIESIKKLTTISYEIIVVDNNSKEEDLRNLENNINNDNSIQLIKNSSNDGFAAGNMLGVKYAEGEYYFFINNDTQLLNDTSYYMVNYLDKNLDIALATAKVKDEIGNFSSSYKLFPSVIKELFGNSIARKFSKYNFPSNKIKLTKPTLVEVVSGSCMFFRAEDFNSVGGFDITFFLYCEEEDLSKRIWNAGKKVIFLPEAEIFHHSGGSSVKSFEMEREYYISYHILLRKHFSFIERVILKFLLFIKLFRRSFKKEYGFKMLICFFMSCSLKFSLRNK